MRVLVPTTPLHFSRNNTDLHYPLNFGKLPRFVSSCNVTLESNLWQIIYSNLTYLCRRTAVRIGYPDTYSQFWAHALERSIVRKRSVNSVDVLFCYAQLPWGASSLGRPVVYNSGFSSNQYSGAKEDIYRQREIDYKSKLFRQATRVIFNTECAVTSFLRLKPEFADIVRSIPFFLPDLRCMDAAEVTQKQNDAKPIHILFVGRDGKRKGIHNLCAALQLIAKDSAIATSCVFHFVTDTAIMIPSGLRVRHAHSAKRNEVMDLMRKAHIFVLPTLRDSYGLVFVEAMAAGCAVIADLEQPRNEILDSGRCGIMVDPHSTQEIANALRNLIVNSHLRLRLAESGRTRAQLHYAPGVIAKQYFSLFQEVSAKHPPS